jgi:hypothetical protein
MLNNVDILELEERYKLKWINRETLDFNSLLMIALKHNKLKTFILISEKFPEYNQRFIINWVFEKRIRRNKTLEYILNNPNKKTIELFEDHRNFKKYYDDYFHQKDLENIKYTILPKYIFSII